MEADTLSKGSYQENVLFIIGKFHFNQLVIVPQGNRLQSGLADIHKISDICLFHHSFFRGHKQIFSLFVFFDGNHRGDPFVRQKLKQVYDGRSPGRSSGFGNLIGLQAIHPTRICEKHHKMVGGGHHQIFNEIFLQRLHSLNAFSASVLALEIIHGHPFDITKPGHGNYHGFVGN